VVKDDEEFLINFADTASVITLSGITIVGKDGNVVVGHATYQWGQMAANGWGLYRQRFGPGSYLISFGDQLANQNFSGLRFDLRRYKGPESVDAFYAEAEAVLQRIFETASPYLAEEVDDDSDEDNNGVNEENSVQAQTLAVDGDQYLADDSSEYEDDSHDEEAEAFAAAEAAVSEAAAQAQAALALAAELQRVQNAQRFAEREKRLVQFLKQFSFVTQRCEETAPRSVFDAQSTTTELWTALNTESGVLAVCVEPGQALLAPSGKLAGWSGPATALSGHGIYHMVSTANCRYIMDGSNCFLSWEKFFFEIKADLVMRDTGPDLWLGTVDKFLIRGSYCDYSVNISQWDYFEDFAKNGLLEALASFKQSI
jgi:hypothetical protein